MRRPRRWDHPTAALGGGLETGTPTNLYRPTDHFAGLEAAWQAATPSATPSPPALPMRRPAPMDRGAAPPVPVEETYTPTSTANELPPAMQLASAIEPSPVSKGKRSAKQEAEAQRLNALIETAALTHGVDPRYVRALIGIESGGNPTAVSNKGALGAMQLMPATAKAMGVTDAMDLEQNIMGGVKYYKQMLDTFDGDPELAAAAYNAGPTAVRKHGGVPPFAETKNYVAKFKRILGR